MKKIYLLISLFVISSGLLHASTTSTKPILIIYTYNSFISDLGAGPKIKDLFESYCNCGIRYVPFTDSIAILKQLRDEAKQPIADLVIGLDNHLVRQAAQSNLFARNNISYENLVLPIIWKNRSFVPYDYGQIAFVYNRTKIDKAPTSLKEMIDRVDLSIIYQDPRSSVGGVGMLSWINYVYNDEKEIADAWNKLAKHTKYIGKDWDSTYKLFTNGAADFVLSYVTSPLYHQIYEHNDEYAAAIFDEGHIVQIEFAARLKSSKKAELAENFLHFLLSPAAQRTIALHNIMLPVINVYVNPQFEAQRPIKPLGVPQPSKNAIDSQIKIWRESTGISNNYPERHL